MADIQSPLPGTFYHKPSPDDAAYQSEGDSVSIGDTIGLVEVMKTFNPVKYAPGGDLPERARLLRFLVEDGTDVEEGQPLAEVEELAGRE